MEIYLVFNVYKYLLTSKQHLNCKQSTKIICCIVIVFKCKPIRFKMSYNVKIIKMIIPHEKNRNLKKN